jgi:hypothetical protein
MNNEENKQETEKQEDKQNEMRKRNSQRKDKNAKDLKTAAAGCCRRDHRALSVRAEASPRSDPI